MEAKDLKACPFCGGKPSVSTYETESLWSHNQVTYTRIGCNDCDIAFNTEPGHEIEAPVAWNRRCPSPDTVVVGREREIAERTLDAAASYLTEQYGAPYGLSHPVDRERILALSSLPVEGGE